MSLRVKCAHHHFASSVETTAFEVRPPGGKKIEDLTLEITDRHGALVYRAAWNAGNLPANRKCEWDGENTESPPVLDSKNATIKQYVNPLGSPYTAKFKAKLAPAKTPKKAPNGVSTSSTGSTQTCPLKQESGPSDDGKEEQEGSAQVRVLYREIKLEPIKWVEVYKTVSGQNDAGFPSVASDDIKKLWLQYKLNELGYVAGPLKNPPEQNSILRSLFRYTQAYPDAALMPKVYDFQTRQAGAAGNCGWGWKAAWEGKYGTLAELCQGTAKQPGIDLLEKLKAGDRSRDDLFKEQANLTEKRLLTRIILDHDIFYINEENTDPDGHADYDKEFLNPFCWPMQLKILLVSKADADAKKPGKDAPKAVGPARCEWVLFDPPENLAIVPAPVGSDVPAAFKSKSRIYIDQLHVKRAGRHGDKADALDNCPQDLGGARPAHADDVSGNFFTVPNASASASPDGRKFLSIASHDVANPHGQLGKTCVFFQGSYIAGDNFVVQARLSWDGITDGDALKKEHQDLSGLARCFGAKKFLGMDENDPMACQTLRMTIWRRHHVLREVTWAETLYPATNWEPIVRNFEAAHILLVPPADPPIHIENLFTAASQRTTLAQALIDGFRSKDPGTNKASPELGLAANKPPSFNRGGLLPIQMPDFNTISPPGPSPQQRFDTYAAYLGALRNEWPTYIFLRKFFQSFREEFDTFNKGPGLVVLRAALLPGPEAGVPGNVSAALPQVRPPFKYGYRALSAGGDHGVVLLDECAIQKFDPTFFVSHEIGHCLFLTHPFQWGGDHDSDANCLMTYNNQNSGEPLGWAVSKQNLATRFHVRVDLSANKRGIASYGSVSSAFTEVDPKTYWFEGELVKCQNAINGLKFTPDKKLEPDTVVTLKLGAEQNKLPPWLSVKIPHSVDVGVRDGAKKPFAGITAKKPDPDSFHPFFCGKCVLKLRGWRVREDAAHTGPANAPTQSSAVPVNPRMEFIGYFIRTTQYLSSASGKPVFLELSVGSKDPLDTSIPLGPAAFLHRHRFTWESSDGNLQSLATIKTREHVKYRQPTQAAPFCEYADPDQEFFQDGDNGDMGKSIDNHSVQLPALICAQPPKAGTLIGEQWYQYSTDGGTTWKNIPGAAYLLEKSVFHNGKSWVLKFAKSNWLPHNQVSFHFEVQYRIGPKPRSQPDIIPNTEMGTPAKNYKSAGSTIVQSGDSKAMVNHFGANTEEVDLKFLKKHGYLA